MAHEKAIIERDFFCPCLKICCGQNMIALFTFWQRRIPFFLQEKRVCDDFSDNFSHDGSDTSYNSHPFSGAEWMSTAEPRQEINTLGLLNTIEILDLNIGKMWNKLGIFFSQTMTLIFQSTWKLAGNIQNVSSEKKKICFPWLLPEIFP